MFTAKRRLRYDIVSQGGTCPLLSEAQGPDQEKKARLDNRRQEQKCVSIRPINTSWARHHFWHPYLIRRGSCPHLGLKQRCCTGVHQCTQSLRGQSRGSLHLNCLEELRGGNWTLPTFLESSYFYEIHLLFPNNNLIP